MNVKRWDNLPGAVLQRFESLGDNCEFGFVQRANGCEDGGLLRWSISPLDKLVRCLDTDFKDFYLLENLEPSAPDMVQDTATGLIFHSAMRSLDGRFVLDTERRRNIYTQERDKMYYMLDKFRRRLGQPSTIGVYKRNIGVADEEADRLRKSLNRLGKNTLLLVRSTTDQAKWSSIERSPFGFLVGFVDRFAPYSNADWISTDVWNNLLNNASEHADGNTKIS
jgi:hypothetical protein